MEFIAKNEIKSIVDYTLTAQLKQRGFKKRAYTWQKDVGEISQIVNVQLGQYNQIHESTFTLNIGTYHERFHLERGLVPVSTTIKEYDCDVRTRIGQLMDGRDHWWTVAYNKDNIKVRDGFRYNVDKCLWLWLEQHCSLKDFHQFFVTNNRFFDAAVAAFLLGHNNTHTLIESAIESANSSFRKTIERWAHKRGIGK